MPSLPTAFRRALRDKALATSRRLSTGPEWEGHVRREFGLLAPGESWREQVTDGFHRLYYEAGEAGRTWKDTRFLGVTTWKVPLDLWGLPGAAVEAAARAGGGDRHRPRRQRPVPGHHLRDHRPRPGGQRRHRPLARPAGPPTAHLPDRLLHRPRGGRPGGRAGPGGRPGAGGAGLRPQPRPRPGRAAGLCPLVTPGSYLVVEDTNVNGHPVYEAFGPGPMEAVQDFLKERDDFEVDRSREKFLFTFNPGGWLRKLG